MFRQNFNKLDILKILFSNSFNLDPRRTARIWFLPKWTGRAWTKQPEIDKFGGKSVARQF